MSTKQFGKKSETRLVKLKRAESLYYKSIISKHNNASKNLWNTFGKYLTAKKNQT